MPAPANWTSVTVAGKYVYPDGTPAAGTVTFTNSLYLRDPDLDLVIVPKPIQVSLDVNGAFTTVLQATDDPDIDPTFYYQVTEVIGGVTTSFPMLVPKYYAEADPAQVLQMADIDRNATIPPAPEVYVRTLNGQYGDIIDDGGGTPADTVVATTSFGMSPAVGTGTDYAREDHSHGTPALPTIPVAGTLTPTAITITGSGAVGTDPDFSREDHVHAGPGFAAPSALTVGGSQAAGSATTVSRSDHVHAMPAFGSVTAQTTAGASSSNGVATTIARSDHTHGTPAAPANDTSTQKSIISKAGTTIGTRQQINFIDGTNITSTIADDSVNNRVNITLTASASGGSVGVAKAGTLVGTRPTINIIDGTNVTTTVTDNSGSNRVDVTITSAGGGGAVPATTVVAETAYGNSSAVGTATGYAREDHTHGSPALTSATPAAESVGASGVVGVATTPARADHVHAMPAFASPTAQTSYGASSAAGSATTIARSDHTHGTPSLTAVTPSTQAVGDTAAVGTGTAPAREDHKHAMPAFGAVTTETTFGQSSSNGVAATIARSDHTHGTPATPTASAVGAIPNSNGMTYYGAGLLSARPAAGTAGRTYYATDLNTEFYDNGTSWLQHDQSPAIANSWTAIGHSYLQSNGFSYNQRSRLDSILRSRWDAEPTNWTNLAISGSRATLNGAAQGGWATMIREINKLPGKTAPYTSSDGGLLICTGINDLGTLGGATTQMQGAFKHAIRFMISRWRASTIFEDTASNITYGGTWTQETAQYDNASGGTWRYTVTASGSTVTLTLPSDYDGETVALMFPGRPGANGGTVTFTGTALASNAANNSTIDTNNVMPSATLSNVPVVKRITGLTSANAGQTIICTVSSNVGVVYFDCAWLEAKEAPPVVICNIPRLTSTGYSTKYSTWTAQTGSLDGDVTAFNTQITSVVSEFDSMVAIADIDSVLNKTASLFVDGLHPNERGAGMIVDEIDNARRRLVPTGAKSAALNMNMAPRYAGGERIRRRSGYYHTTEFTGTGTAYAPVAGDMFAIPFEVTEPDEKYTNLALERVAPGSATGTIRWGIYADYMNSGYPDIQYQEYTSGGALTVTNAAGVLTSPNGQYTWYPDIGLYWLVLYIETAGTGITLATVQGPNSYMPQGTTAGLITTAPKAVGWKASGVATGTFLSNKTTFPTGATPVLAAPYIGCLKA